MAQQSGGEPERHDPEWRAANGMPGMTSAAQSPPNVKSDPPQGAEGFAWQNPGNNIRLEAPVNSLSSFSVVDANSPVDKGRAISLGKRRLSKRESIEWWLLTIGQIAAAIYVLIYPVVAFNSLQQLESIRVVQERAFQQSLYGGTQAGRQKPININEVSGWIIVDAVFRVLIAAAMFVVFGRCKQVTVPQSDPKSVSRGGPSLSASNKASEPTKLVLPFEQ